MFFPVIKPEPKRPTAFEKFVKVVTVIGAIAAIAAIAYILYKKFTEYMRTICEENCDDYLDDCCCDGADCETCDIHDDSAPCDFADDSIIACDCTHDDEPEIEVEIADESDFEEGSDN